METVKLWIGSVTTGSGGLVEDGRRPVEFEAEMLGELTTHHYDDRGGLSDTRGATETLYRTADGDLLVHVKDWSRWQGEPTVEHLHGVTEADLSVGGRFEDLGRQCGFGRPLTWREAVTPLEELEQE